MEAYVRLVQIAIDHLRNGDLAEGIRVIEDSFRIKPGNPALLEHLALARYTLTLETREEILGLARFFVLSGEYGFARSLASYLQKRSGPDMTCLQIITLSDSAFKAQEQGHLLPQGSAKGSKEICQGAEKLLETGSLEKVREAEELYQKALSIRPYDGEALQGYALCKMLLTADAQELQVIGNFLIQVKKRASLGQRYLDTALTRVKERLQSLFDRT